MGYGLIMKWVIIEKGKRCLSHNLHADLNGTFPNNTNFCIQFRITLKSMRSQCLGQRNSLDIQPKFKAGEGNRIADES